MVKCTSERIAEELAEEIRSGMLRAGAALPSVDALRARFGAGETVAPESVNLNGVGYGIQASTWTVHSS